MTEPAIKERVVVKPTITMVENINKLDTLEKTELLNETVMLDLRKKIVSFAEDESIKHGLVVNRVSGEFTSEEGEIQIQVSTVRDLNLDRYGKLYLRHGKELGLEPWWLGMSFSHPQNEHEKYRLTGLVENPDGKETKKSKYMVRLKGAKANHQYVISATLIGLLRQQDEENATVHKLSTTNK
jgi:hypothetical protein